MPFLAARLNFLGSCVPFGRAVLVSEKVYEWLALEHTGLPGVVVQSAAVERPAPADEASRR